jgi:hypothetical protein
MKFMSSRSRQVLRDALQLPLRRAPISPGRYERRPAGLCVGGHRRRCGQIEENAKKAQRDLREAIWRTYKNVLLPGKDENWQTVDVGLVQSNAAETLVKLIVNRLAKRGTIEPSQEVEVSEDVFIFRCETAGAVAAGATPPTLIPKGPAGGGVTSAPPTAGDTTSQIPQPPGSEPMAQRFARIVWEGDVRPRSG